MKWEPYFWKVLISIFGSFLGYFSDFRVVFPNFSEFWVFFRIFESNLIGDLFLIFLGLASIFSNLSEYFGTFPNCSKHLTFEVFFRILSIFSSFARKKAGTGFLGSRFFPTMIVGFAQLSILCLPACYWPKYTVSSSTFDINKSKLDVNMFYTSIHVNINHTPICWHLEILEAEPVKNIARVWNCPDITILNSCFIHGHIMFWFTSGDQSWSRSWGRLCVGHA